MSSNYVMAIQAPLLLTLRRKELYFFAGLASVSAALPFILLDADWHDLEEMLGGVLLASGLLPILLAFPQAMARAYVFSQMNSHEDGAWKRWFFSDWTGALSLLVYAASTAAGWLLILDVGSRTGLLAQLSEIFAEVAIIRSIEQASTANDDDITDLLTAAEKTQYQRSGYLHAPFAAIADMATKGTYHDQLEHLFPHDLEGLDVEKVKESVAQYSLTAPNEEEESANGHEAEEEKKSDVALMVSPKHSVPPVEAYVSELLNSNATGWESPWWVVALGHGSRKVLGKEMIAGLLAVMSGASAGTNRYVQQAAVTALGNLFIGTGDRKLSLRLFDMWQIHEISTVRDHCVVSIEAVGFKPMVAFVKEVSTPSTIHNINVTKSFYSSLGMDTSALEASTMAEVCNTLDGPQRIMGIIKACMMFDDVKMQHTAEDLDQFWDSVLEPILLDPMESHLALALALEALTRSVRATGRLQLDARWMKGYSDRLWLRASELLTNSVFKSVRTAASLTLEAAQYPYTKMYACMGKLGTDAFIENGFSAATVLNVLQQGMPEELLERLKKGTDGVKGTDQIKKLHEIFPGWSGVGGSRADMVAMSGTHTDERNFAEPWKDATLRLYAAMSIERPASFLSDTFIQALLNSEDRIERYVAVVCIGVQASKRSSILKMKREVLPRVLENELVSDVRDLCQAIVWEEIEEETTELDALKAKVKAREAENFRGSALMASKGALNRATSAESDN